MKYILLILLIALMGLPCNALMLRERGYGRYVDEYGRLWVFRSGNLYINGYYVERADESDYWEYMRR